MAPDVLNPLAFLWRAQGLEWLFRPPDHSSPVADATRVKLRKSAPGKRVQRREGSSSVGGSVADAPAGASAFYAVPQREECPAWPQDAPLPWQELLARSGRASVVWTYFGLGDDMVGNPSGQATRSAFLRRLLKDLGHPRGSHGFWPMALGGVARPDLFFAGAASMGARGAVLFGSQAASGLGLAGARPLLRMSAGGLLIQILWDLDALASHEKNYPAALAFLRQALGALL